MTAALAQSALRLRALLAKEFLQLLRDPRMRFFVVVPPIIQLFVFGYAATFDVRNANVAVVDEAQTQTTRDLLSSVTATGHFNFFFYPDMRQAGQSLDRGQVRAIVHFDPQFAHDPRVQIVADGSDSNSAQLVVAQLMQALRQATPQNQTPPALDLETRAWFNQNLDDRYYIVPGVIANVVLVATIILAAMTVVRERELGTLERLMVTPLGRWEFVIAKMLPVACVGLFDVALISGVAVIWFDVPFRGNPFALLLGAVLFLMSSLGLGLLISTYSSTQQQAVLSAFFVIIPFIVLSGFAFPIRNMPQAVQWFTWIDPLRYFLVVIRDLFLKGGGVLDHLHEFAMMSLLGAGALLLSVLRLR